MPMIQFIPDTLILSSEVNQNFDNTVALDTSRTVLVPHTWNARQNLIGGILVGAGNAQQPSLALNLNGSVGPVGFYRKQGDLIGIAGRLDVPPGPQGPPGPPGAPGIQVSDRFDNIIEPLPDDRDENLAENRDFNDGPIGSAQDPHFYVSASGVWASSTPANAWQPPRAAQYDNAAQSPGETAILFINGQPPGAGLIPLEDFWGFRLVVRAKISPPGGAVPTPLPFLHISWRNGAGTQIGSSTRALNDLTTAYRRYALEGGAPPGTVFAAFSIRVPKNAQDFSFQFDGLDIRRLVEDGAAYAQYQWTDVRFFGDPSTRASRAAAVNAAIEHAKDNDAPAVFVPANFQNYDVSLVTFDPDVRIVREGQVTDGFDVRAYGAAGDGTQDDAAAILAADDAADAVPGRSHVIIPPGAYNVDADLTLTAPVQCGGHLRPDNGTTTVIEAPFVSTGNKVLDVDRGGVIRFGSAAGQTIDARYFGAIPGQGASGGAAVAEALNEVFDCWRASTLADDITPLSSYTVGIRLAPGDYHVADSIWAGSPGSVAADRRGYTLEAWSARLIATPDLSDRVVFDMSGARRAKIQGLGIFTDTSQAEAPRIGMMMARPAGGQSIGLGIFDSIRVDGQFKTASVLQYGSEVDHFKSCEFRNSAGATPAFSFLIQGTDVFDATSEFIQTATGSVSNIDHFFTGCQFRTNYQGPDFSVGGCVRIHTAQNLFFDQCYFDAANVEGQTGIRTSSVIDLSLTDTHFHQNVWGAYIWGNGPLHNVDIQGCGRAVTMGGAIIRMSENQTINRCYIRDSVTASASDLTGRFMIDGRAPNCSVSRAIIIGPYRTEISGSFDGSIEVPVISRVALSNQAVARVIEQSTMKEYLIGVPLHPLRTADSDSSFTIGDANGIVRRSAPGSASNVTYTFPDPNPFILGTFIEVYNSATAGGTLTLVDAVDSARLRFFQGNGSIGPGPVVIPPGYGVKCIKLAGDNWQVLPISGAGWLP